MAGNDDKYKGMRETIERMRIARESRAEAQYQRESFFLLHQRQQDGFYRQANINETGVAMTSITLNSSDRLRVYVTLLDVNLGPFIADARSKAKLAYLGGKRMWHHHYTVDVADITIRLRGRTVLIKIAPADAFYFEFATSAHPIKVKEVDQEDDKFGTYQGCMVGVNVQVRESALTYKPTILKQKRDDNFADMSLIYRQAQAQLVNEPVVYPFTTYKFGRRRFTNTLFEAYCPGHSWTGAMARCSANPISPFTTLPGNGPYSTFWSRDVFFDVPYEDNHKAQPTRLAYIRENNTDWPRANGKQRVKHKDFGEREFAIYVTAFNEFIVFPTAGILPLNIDNPYVQNVPESMCKRLQPELPAWVWKPTVKAVDYYEADQDMNHWCVDQPDIEWKFDHEGKHAAAVMFEREWMEFDAPYWASGANPDGSQEMTQADFDAYIVPWAGNSADYPLGFQANEYNPQAYFICPVIVELTIAIELTGPDLEDYEAKLTVEVVRRPATEERADWSRYTLLVGYVWYDIPKRSETAGPIKAGTLVSVDIEKHVWLPNYHWEGSLTLHLLSVRDVKTNAELMSCVGAPILAADLTTLSLVLKLESFSKDWRSCRNVNLRSPNPKDIEFVTTHTAAWIIHSGITKEILFPKTMPEPEKLVLTGYSKMTGKEYLKSLAPNTQEMWSYVPVNTKKDGWVDAGIAEHRFYWAKDKHWWYQNWFVWMDPAWEDYGTGYPELGYIRYKEGDGEGETTPTATKAAQWLNQHIGNYEHLLFCKKPRWGWHAYNYVSYEYMKMSMWTTFFTHPNGTYAFFCDMVMYDRNGVPWWSSPGSGPGLFAHLGQFDRELDRYDWEYDTLPHYDVKKIEHVIFDRVNFEIKVKDRPARKKKTSFRELYNRAVDLGNQAKTLPEDQDIQKMEEKDLQATFEKGIGHDPVPKDGVDFLDLKITYHNDISWLPDYAYMRHTGGGSQVDLDYPPLTSQVGTLRHWGLYGLIRTKAAGQEGGVSDTLGGAFLERPYNEWPHRFSNALVIMEK